MLCNRSDGVIYADSEGVFLNFLDKAFCLNLFYQLNKNGVEIFVQLIA